MICIVASVTSTFYYFTTKINVAFLTCNIYLCVLHKKLHHIRNREITPPFLHAEPLTCTIYRMLAFAYLYLLYVTLGSIVSVMPIIEYKLVVTIAQ